VFLLMRPFRCRYCAYFEFRSVFTNPGPRTT
jgi:predicted Zn-ribbon and HTH transcriptional regulator